MSQVIIQNSILSSLEGEDAQNLKNIHIYLKDKSGL